MKQLRITSLLLLLIFVSITISASTKSKTDLIEANLLKGLNSGNIGLQTSCAYFLGELKSQKAILPLMRIFRSSDNNNKLRSEAAISFIKIGDPRGIFLIKREAIFSDSQRIKKMCTHLYKSYKANRFSNSFNSNKNLVITEVSN